MEWFLESAPKFKRTDHLKIIALIFQGQLKIEEQLGGTHSVLQCTKMQTGEFSIAIKIFAITAKPTRIRNRFNGF